MIESCSFIQAGCIDLQFHLKDTFVFRGKENLIKFMIIYNYYFMLGFNATLI